jgi:hypothetical protein
MDQAHAADRVPDLFFIMFHACLACLGDPFLAAEHRVWPSNRPRPKGAPHSA